ncbi:hypothetical protein NDU88_009959 [Pleurodeles waltl]|uniref:Uncharacterized protein n=1 Tax=Pleurodeles waltl TaxID=8319 RepID=A0AAV7PUL9_PLEWA|nr:hypothetical protein NDU88_009959 [Pleurodeles waltl]
MEVSRRLLLLSRHGSMSYYEQLEPGYEAYRPGDDEDVCYIDDGLIEGGGATTIKYQSLEREVEQQEYAKDSHVGGEEYSKDASKQNDPSEQWTFRDTKAESQEEFYTNNDECPETGSKEWWTLP